MTVLPGTPQERTQAFAAASFGHDPRVIVDQPKYHRRRIRSFQSVVVVYAIGILLIFVVAAPYINYDTLPSTGEGNSMRQFSYLAILIAVIAGARYHQKPRRLLVLPMGVAIALAWCWISLVWSISPDIGVRRAILTTAIVLTIFLAVEHLGFESTIKIIRVIMLFVLVANYTVVIVWPSSGIHQVQELGGDPGLIGNWRGVLIQKNFAGAFCALTIIFYVFGEDRIGSTSRTAMLLASSFFLFETRSKTSMFLLFLALALGYAYLRYNPRFRCAVFVVLFVTVTMTSMICYEEWDSIAVQFSGEDSLTGRVQIWPVLLAYWRDHWLGAGFGSFWNIGPGSPVFQYGKGWVTGLGNGHNGYLDLLSQIGLPGLLLVVGAFVIWPLFRILSSFTMPRRRGALLMAVLVFCAGHNMTETSLLDRDSIVQVFLVFALALINVATGTRRQQALGRSSVLLQSHVVAQR